MSYEGRFLQAKGQVCTIERDPPVETRASVKRSTRASMQLAIRAGYWEGLIPVETKLKSGEMITISDKLEVNRYLVQDTGFDPQSRQIAFFAAKCNVVMDHKRYEEGVDEEFNPIQEWKDLNTDIYCYGEVVNQKIRQEIPGLLEGTIYIFQVPKKLEIAKLDRITYNDTNYQVVSIDDIGLKGVSQIQLAEDLRPD